MPPTDHTPTDAIGSRLRALRGPTDERPDMAVVMPVNAQGDLENVKRPLADLARYEGPHTVEVILVVNNFAEGHTPPEVEGLRRLGVKVIAIPNVRSPGIAVCLSARIPGVRAASADYAVIFDADCQLPHVTTLLNWYAEQFRRGAHAAYTPVGYYDCKDALSIRFLLAVHHTSRWFKRVVLRIPTTRGSNYAVRCQSMLELYDEGYLGDDLNVGPAMKELKGPVEYGSGKRLTVYTSGRVFQPGWRGTLPYFLYRLRYNLKVLPVRPDVARFTGRENDPVDRYRYLDKQRAREDGHVGAS